MKFDFCIGNPPYQETKEGTSDSPVYNEFMDAAFDVADKVELITPARFLFNAGKTPKAWNKKMLADEHFKVAYYENDACKIFANTEIKGGVAVTYRDSSRKFGAIGTFTAFAELNSIIKKVLSKSDESVSDIVFAPESYKFTREMHDEHPEIKNNCLLSKGHDFDVTSNIFDKLDNIVFFTDKGQVQDGIQILGRKNNSRIRLWICRKYISPHQNLDRYKLFFPKSNGSGKFGEISSPSEVGEPGVGHSQTFISMGAFNSLYEAESLSKYVKCKFTRAMLGVLKVTQDNKKSVWKFVPLQNFTENSDINWDTSISEIDQQLYKKYGLSEEEINFIETHVKEMK